MVMLEAKAVRHPPLPGGNGNGNGHDLYVPPPFNEQVAIPHLLDAQHLEGKPPPPPEFFTSPYVEDTFYNFLGPDTVESNGGMMNRERSRFRNNLLRAYIPNSIIVIDKNGREYINTPFRRKLRLHPADLDIHDKSQDIVYGRVRKYKNKYPEVKSVDVQKLKDMELAVFVPASWWVNGYHLTEIHLGDGHRKASMTDLDEASRDKAFSRWGRALKYLHEKDGRPVFFGGNHSQFNLEPGWNLQSALAAHVSMFKPRNELGDKMTADGIIEVRNAVGWDEGLSQKFFGEDRNENNTSLRDEIQNIVNDYSFFKDVGVEVDRMGVHFFKEGMTAEIFNNPEFAVFWTRVSRTIHHRLDELATLCWGDTITHNGEILQELDQDEETPDAVSAARTAYARAFGHPLDKIPDDLSQAKKEIITKMAELDARGLLNHYPGWNFGMGIGLNKDGKGKGAFFGISGGFMNRRGIGPAQTVAIVSNRLPVRRPEKEAAALNSEFMHEIKDALLGRLRVKSPGTVYQFSPN